MLYLIDGVSKVFSRVILTLRQTCHLTSADSLSPKNVKRVAQCLTHRKCQFNTFSLDTHFPQSTRTLSLKLPMTQKIMYVIKPELSAVLCPP